MSREVKIADIVLYIDENRYQHAAIVAYVHPLTSNHIDRPTCNLARIKHDGSICRAPMVEPGYHDGVRWKLINKWVFPEDCPQDEFEEAPQPSRGLSAFSTRHPSTT